MNDTTLGTTPDDLPTPPTPTSEEALAAKVDELRGEVGFWQDAANARMDERDEAQKQVDDLRADRAAVIAALGPHLRITDDLPMAVTRLRALAESGDQPGDDAIRQVRDPNPDHPLWGYRRANCPAPPVPAAEDDAVERARAAFANATDGDDPTTWAGTPWWHVYRLLAALDAAGVPALRAEVERQTRIAESERSMAAHIAERAVPVAEGFKAQRDEARQQVADLRDAVADVLGGSEVGPGRLRDRLRAALAGSGEQPGEVTFEDHYLRGGKSKAEWYRNPAPVVPDGAGLIERTIRDAEARWHALDVSAIPAAESLNESRVRFLARAVLAVVGQGVTGAEQHDPHAALAPELVSLLADWDANDEDDNYSKGEAASDLRAALRRACGCERGHLPHARRCPERLDRRPTPSTTPEGA